MEGRESVAMKYYVVCDTDEHKFCEEIDFEDESAICEVITDQFNDIIHEAIDSYDPEPGGFFTEPMLFYAEMH